MSYLGVFALVLAVVAVAAQGESGDLTRPGDWEYLVEDSKVVGGTQDYKPFMVMTLDQRDGQNFRGACGATMISAKWALTAAHCVSNAFRNDLLAKMDVAYIGPYTPWEKFTAGNGQVLNNGGKQYDVVKIKRVFEHPHHKAGAASKHDMALILLEGEVDLQKFPDFKPARLPSSATVYGQVATVSGLGQTSYQGPKSQKLLSVDVKKWQQTDCANKMKERNMAITSDMICFGGEAGKDSCGGDSGGPLTVKTAGGDTLVGVVSWGYKCAEPGFPGVYSSVFYHLDWIRAQMASPNQSVAGPTTTVPAPAPQPATPKPSSCSGSDTHTKCNKWARKGHCTKTNVKVACPQSCCPGNRAKFEDEGAGMDLDSDDSDGPSLSGSDHRAWANSLCFLFAPVLLFLH